MEDKEYVGEGIESLAALAVAIVSWIGHGYVLSLIALWVYGLHVRTVQAMIAILVVRHLCYWRPGPKNQDEYWKRHIGMAILPWIILGMVWLVLAIGGPR